MAEGKTVSTVPLNESNYGTWRIQCRMALTKDGLWGIVSGTEAPPAEADADKYRKFVARRDRALAIIVLSVDPWLLYLLCEPENPGTVWKKLAKQFQKKALSNKLAVRRRYNNLRLKEGESVQKHVKAMTVLFSTSCQLLVRRLKKKIKVLRCWPAFLIHVICLLLRWKQMQKCQVWRL